MSGELRKPAEPTAKKKKERLFSDDFERAELGKDKGWAIGGADVFGGGWHVDSLRTAETIHLSRSRLTALL
jgi:hypothetical protein